MVCGMIPPSGKIHVDHIKPSSKYPKLALILDNLQVLCQYCNLGSLNFHNDDWCNGHIIRSNISERYSISKALSQCIKAFFLKILLNV